MATSALVAMKWTEAQQAARRMVESARLSGDLSTEFRVLPASRGIARYGPLPADQGIARCDDLLTRAIDPEPDGSECSSGVPK